MVDNNVSGWLSAQMYSRVSANYKPNIKTSAFVLPVITYSEYTIELECQS